jgi:hypothetical protein
MRATKAVQVAGSHVQTKGIQSEILTVGRIAKVDKRHGKIPWLSHVVIVWRTLVPNEVGESVPPAAKARKTETAIARKTVVGTELAREIERRTGIVIGIETETGIGTGTGTDIVVTTKTVKETGKIARVVLPAVRLEPVQQLHMMIVVFPLVPIFHGIATLLKLLMIALASVDGPQMMMCVRWIYRSSLNWPRDSLNEDLNGVPAKKATETNVVVEPPKKKAMIGPVMQIGVARSVIPLTMKIVERPLIR